MMLMAMGWGQTVCDTLHIYHTLYEICFALTVLSIAIYLCSTLEKVFINLQLVKLPCIPKAKMGFHLFKP